MSAPILARIQTSAGSSVPVVEQTGLHGEGGDMAYALEGRVDPSDASELASALDALIDRISARGDEAPADRSLFEMGADEIDAMLGLHRIVDPMAGPDLARGGDTSTAPVTADGTPPPAHRARAAQEDAAGDRRRTRLPGTTIDTSVALAVVAIVAGCMAAAIAGPLRRPDVRSEPTDTKSAAVAVDPGTTVAPNQVVPDRVVPYQGNPDQVDPDQVASGSDTEIADRVQAALLDAAVIGASTTVDDGAVVVDAVAAPGSLVDGYFALVEEIRTVAAVEGARTVDVRLELRGDAATLRADLVSLTAYSPVLFGSGSADVDQTHAGTLDGVAAAIVAQPGLTVIVAGTTDPSGSAESNERLARLRAGSVVAELVDRGVPSNRLQAVSYGELFGDAGAAARGIRFEVGA